MLLIPFVSSYAGFTDAASLFVADNVVTANDDAIYYQGWFSANNQNWESFTFPDAQTQGWILDGSATKILPDVFTPGGEHYVLVYSCSKGNVWSCYGGQWQIFKVEVAVCVPQSNAITCDGKCNTQLNNCQNQVDCGPCSPPESFPVTVVNVFASSSSSSSTPQLTIDNDFDTAWGSYGDGESITFDVGVIHVISAVDIAFYKGDTRHASFSVVVSDDTVNWLSVFDGQASGSTLDFEHFEFTPVAARYVRIIGHGNDDIVESSRPYNTYAEVQLYATDVQSCVDDSLQQTCGARVCGSMSNNCNRVVSCGSCGANQYCDAGVCKVLQNNNDKEVLLNVDFDNLPLGQYDCADWANDWNKPYSIWCDSNNPDRERYTPTVRNTKIIQGDAANPSQVLEVIYPYTHYGGTGGNGWGSPLGDNYEEMYMTFKVKFKEGFEPKRGGKLHGLTGGDCPGGCQGVCHDGFSSRFTFWGDGGFTPYVYFPEQLKNCGQSCSYDNTFCVYEDIQLTSEKFVFEQGKWYELTMRVVMNDHGVKNGIIETFVDGKLSQQKTGMLLRELGKTYGIDEFYFITFFGGGTDCLTDDPDESCDAPNSKDEYTYFDDFFVWKYKDSAAGVPHGQTPHPIDAVIVPPR